MDERLEDIERERKQKAVDDARKLLEECGFDAVVVMGSWQTEDGCTAAVKANAGNWYSQSGMMQYELDRRRQSAFIEEQQKEM